MADFYVAGMIHDWPENLRMMKVLCVYCHRYANYKLLGGNSILDDSGRVEVPGETLKREIAFKSGVTVIQARLCHHEKIPSGHQRYFYLILKASLPSPMMFPKEIIKPGRGVGPSDKLVCNWIPIENLVRDLYSAQLVAFAHIIQDMATDKVTGSEFYKAFPDLVNDCLRLT